MGFTGFARWQNAPTTGLDLIRDNIMHNHQGAQVGRWLVQLKVYRSTILTMPGMLAPPERTMCTLTISENTFVLVEDPGVPGWSQVQELRISHEQEQLAAQAQAVAEGSAPPPLHPFRPPPHYNLNIYTVKAPGSLEHMLGQLRSRWTQIRHGVHPGRADAPQRAGGNHATIDGTIFRVGQDWIVRVGNVIMAGGNVKGLLVEAEYLPAPVLPTNDESTSDLLSNFLAAIVPLVPDAKVTSISINNFQWEAILHHKLVPNTPDDAQGNPNASRMPAIDAAATAAEDDDDEDLYDYPGKPFLNSPSSQDWIGTERDRRSAVLVWASLKSDGLL